MSALLINQGWTDNLGDIAIEHIEGQVSKE